MPVSVVEAVCACGNFCGVSLVKSTQSALSSVRSRFLEGGLCLANILFAVGTSSAALVPVVGSDMMLQVEVATASTRCLTGLSSNNGFTLEATDVVAIAVADAGLEEAASCTCSDDDTLGSTADDPSCWVQQATESSTALLGPTFCRSQAMSRTNNDFCCCGVVVVI